MVLVVVEETIDVAEAVVGYNEMEVEAGLAAGHTTAVAELGSLEEGTGMYC